MNLKPDNLKSDQLNSPQEPLTEFTLIDRYFAHRQIARRDVVLGMGDDCALLLVPQNHLLAVSSDSLVAGTHFLPQANPAWVAHKALTSNLSDLAAMGAEPAWVSMALTLPELDRVWLDAFCDAFFQLADKVGIQLIGGDTTKGPLSITLTVQGFVPQGEGLLRSGARVGDLIYVSGTLGDSKAGLDVILEPQFRTLPYADQLEARHYLKTAQLTLGQVLRKYASSAIDISDGLIADLSHILKQSGVGACIDVAQLPISQELKQYCLSKMNNSDSINGIDKTDQNFTLAQYYALTSGEEYELCFTVQQELREAMEEDLLQKGIDVTCIGEIKASTSVELRNEEKPLNHQISGILCGYEHFKGV